MYLAISLFTYLPFTIYLPTYILFICLSVCLFVVCPCPSIPPSLHPGQTVNNPAFSASWRIASHRTTHITTPHHHITSHSATKTSNVIVSWNGSWASASASSVGTWWWQGGEAAKASPRESVARQGDTKYARLQTLDCWNSPR